MSISDEIVKLADLRDRGILSPAEFEQAKKRVLNGERGDNDSSRPRITRRRVQFDDDGENSLGKAANLYVWFQIFMALVVISIFLIFFAPGMCSSQSPFIVPSGFPR
ncbi:MAG: SHOCT domain-containing protein [Verrucomicrobiales bacterium]